MGTKPGDKPDGGGALATLIQFPVRPVAVATEGDTNREPIENVVEIKDAPPKAHFDKDGVADSREERRHLQMLGAKRMVACAILLGVVVGTIALIHWW